MEKIIYWSRFVKLSGAFCVLVVCAVMGAQALQESKKTGMFVSDFVAYWAGFHLVQEGRNPYDLEEFRSFKHETGYDRTQETDYVFWYVPWFLILFAPFLAWPFPISAALWLICNLCFPMILSFLSWKVFRPDERQSMTVLFLSGMILAPFIFLLRMGQISFWIVLGVIGTVLCLEKKRDFWAGWFLILTTIKPQTIFLFYLLLGIWAIQNKRFRVLTTFIGIFLALQISVLMLWPALYSHWITTCQNPLDFFSTTLASFLWCHMSGAAGKSCEWIFLALPCFAALGGIFYFLRRKVVWKNHLPAGLLLSLIFMPYGGLSDYNLLAITQTAIVGDLLYSTRSVNRRNFVITGLLAYHLFTLIVLFQCGRNLHHLWWYPIPFLFFLNKRTS